MSRGKFSRKRRAERNRLPPRAKQLVPKYVRPDFVPLARVVPANPDREGTEYYRSAPSVILNTSTAPEQTFHRLHATELEAKGAALGLADDQLDDYVKRERTAIEHREALKTRVAPLYNKGALQLITSIDQAKDIGRK